MPVVKFRSLAEAERALWLEPGDARIWAATCRRWALHLALGRGRTESRRGVYRYRSIEEKQRDEPA